jgi:hypothetical protein
MAILFMKSTRYAGGGIVSAIRARRTDRSVGAVGASWVSAGKVSPGQMGITSPRINVTALLRLRAGVPNDHDDFDWQARRRAARRAVRLRPRTGSA